MSAGTTSLDEQTALRRFRRARRVQGWIFFLWICTILMIVWCVLLVTGTEGLTDGDVAWMAFPICAAPCVVASLIGVWGYLALNRRKRLALQSAGPAGQREHFAPFGMPNDWAIAASLAAAIVLVLFGLYREQLSPAFVRLLHFAVVGLFGGVIVWSISATIRTSRGVQRAIEAGDFDAALAQTVPKRIHRWLGSKIPLEYRQQVYLAFGKYADALALQPDIEAAIRGGRKIDVVPGIAYALALAGSGLPDEALEVVERFGTVRPQQPYADSAYAYIVLQYEPLLATPGDAVTRLAKVASQQFRRVVPLESADFLSLYAWALAAAGRDDEARQFAAQAVQRVGILGRPDQQVVLYQLGRAFAALGDKAAAREHLTDAHALIPSTRVAQHARDSLYALDE